MNPRRFPAWNGFDHGEVTPLGDGRVDVEGYRRSCDTVKNMLCTIQGPAERRPGSRHVGSVENNSYASRLIPFRYSADISFALELGHETMRFFYLGTRIVFSESITNGTMEGSGASDWLDDGSPTTNEYSTEQAHAGSYSRKFVAAVSGDGIKSAVFSLTSTSGKGVAVSLFVRPSVETVLVRVRKQDDSGWAYSQQYTVIPNIWNWIHFDYDNTITGALGYVSVVSTATDPTGTFYIDDVSLRLIVRTVTPWAASDLAKLKYKQVGNVVYFAHPDYPVYKLTRESTYSWPLEEVDFAWGPFLDQNTTSITLTVSVAPVIGTMLTASSPIFEAGHVGAVFKITGDKPTTDDLTAVGNGTAVTLQAAQSFVVSLSGTWVGTMILQRSYDAGSTWLDYVSYTANASVELVNLEDDTQWRWRMDAFTSGTCTAAIIERNISGYGKVTTVSTSTLVLVDVIEAFPHMNATTKWAEGAWSDVQGYPRALSFYENRLVLASTALKPIILWGSKYDDYESHETGSTDDKSYSFPLASADVNQINWMQDGDILHIGTSGDEWKFGDKDEATTANNPNAKSQTPYGSADIEAIKVAGYIVFVEDGAKSLRIIRYNYERDKYEAEDVSDKAEHLFNDAYIVGMCYTARPVPIIWLTLSDGSFVGATFDPIRKVIAYHRHEIGGNGFVEYACAIRGVNYDELWLEVKRTVNSVEVRHIEYIQFAQWSDKEDAYYVDNGYTFSETTATKYFTGLNQFEGQTVKVYADGAIHAPVTVTNNAIELDYEVNKVSIGEGYDSVLSPKRLELFLQGGDTTQGRSMDIKEAVIRLYKTMACRVGTNEGETDPIIFRTTLTPLGEAPDIFSGDKLVTIRGGGENGKITIETDEPVPMTVIGIFPRVTLNSDN